MSTEHHEALKLADALEKDSLHMMAVDLAAAAMIRTQHALIVQMAEALAVALPDLSGSYLLEARNAIAAATQYLTRGPKT